MSKFNIGDKVTIVDGSWSICITGNRFFERIQCIDGEYEIIALPTDENADLVEVGTKAKLHDAIIMDKNGAIFLHSTRYLRMNKPRITYPVVASMRERTGLDYYYVMFTGPTTGMVIHRGPNALYSIGQCSKSWASLEDFHDEWEILNRKQTKVLVDNLRIGRKS